MAQHKARKLTHLMSFLPLILICCGVLLLYDQATDETPKRTEKFP